MTENQPDEFSGVGGSYVLDPATGLRTLVERTQDHPANEPTPEPTAPEQPDAGE